MRNLCAEQNGSVVVFAVELTHFQIPFGMGWRGVRNTFGVGMGDKGVGQELVGSFVGVGVGSCC